MRSFIFLLPFILFGSFSSSTQVKPEDSTTTVGYLEDLRQETEILKQSTERLKQVVPAAEKPADVQIRYKHVKTVKMVKPSLVIIRVNGNSFYEVKPEYYKGIPVIDINLDTLNTAYDERR